MDERDCAAPKVGGSFRRYLAVLAVLTVLTTAAAQTPSTSYVDAAVPLLAAAAGTPQGTLLPGTAVTVLGSSGADAQVRLSGWSMQGSATVVFEDIGLRVILARLNNDAKVERKVEQTKTDDYGSVWQQVTVVGWVAAHDLVSNIDTVWSAGQQIYQARCSACHALHSPSEFTANQWPGILRAMGKNASLDPAQLALVTRYLQAHARGR